MRPSDFEPNAVAARLREAVELRAKITNLEEANIALEDRCSALLRACKLMVSTWDTYLPDAKHYRAYRQAKAAIAKAEEATR